MPPPSAKRRTRLALALLAFATTLAFAELAASLLVADFVRGELRSPSWNVCARFDPGFGWANRPGARAHIRGGGLDYRVRIDAAGWRDVGRSAAPAPRTRRVLLLGDSVAWGWGVDEDARFGDLLDARLGHDVEVLNLAVPGYATDQELWTLMERGLAYRPHAVLLCVVLNDLDEVESDRAYGMPRPRFVLDGDGWRVDNRPVPPLQAPWKRALRSAWPKAVAHSALLTALVRWRADPDGDLPPQRAWAAPTEAALAALRARCETLIDPGSVQHMLLRRISEACAERGLPLLAFSVPHKHDEHLYEPLALRSLGAEAAPRRTHLAQRLEEAGARLGFATACVDEALLERVLAGERLHCGDGHLNEAGNLAVADALEPHVRALLERSGSR